MTTQSPEEELERTLRKTLDQNFVTGGYRGLAYTTALHAIHVAADRYANAKVEDTLKDVVSGGRCGCLTCDRAQDLLDAQLKAKGGR